MTGKIDSPAFTLPEIGLGYCTMDQNIHPRIMRNLTENDLRGRWKVVLLDALVQNDEQWCTTRDFYKLFIEDDTTENLEPIIFESKSFDPKTKTLSG